MFKAIKAAIEIAAIMFVIAVVWFVFKISTFSLLSEEEIRWWIRASEIVLFVSAILLAVGLMGEWAESEVWRKSFLYQAAKTAVIVGVLSELLGDAGIFEADNRLQEIDGTAITKAADSAKTALGHATAAETRANNLLQENIKLQMQISQQGNTLGGVVTKLADREIQEDVRQLIKRRLRGNERHVTIVLPIDREPRSYGIKIAEALQAAGFDVLIDNWRGVTPSNTGVVFCEIHKGDRPIYDVLHRAHVATQFISLKDQRPDFCDPPGVEAPIERFIAGVTLGVVTPESAGGRIIPRGSLAGQYGPRIFVGQREQ